MYGLLARMCCIIFYLFHKHNSLRRQLKHPSSTSTKELVANFSVIIYQGGSSKQAKNIPALFHEAVSYRHCDQIVRFLKILCVKVPFKISPNIWWLFGLSENITFKVKTAVSTFWATFGKLWSSLNFNTWSHWLQKNEFTVSPPAPRRHRSLKSH